MQFLFSRVGFIFLFLSMVGGQLGADRYNPNYPSYGLTPAVQSAINRALAQYNDYTKNQILLEGAGYARIIDDIIALAGHCTNSYTKTQIVSNKEHLARSVDDVIRLSDYIDNSYSRDQILLNGVKLARNINDIILLAGKCQNSYIKSQIASADRISLARDVNEVVSLARQQNNNYTHDQVLLNGVKLARTSYEINYLANAAKTDYTRRQILNSSGNYNPPNPGPGNGDYNDDYCRRMYNSGKKFQDRNRFYEALNYYNQGKSYNNVYAARCLYFAAYCYVKLGRYYEATNDYRVYINRYPYGDQIEAAHYVLGRTYEQSGNYNNAREWYQRTIQKYPYSTYASKARQRLNQLGGGYNPPYPGNGNPSYPAPIVEVEMQSAATDKSLSAGVDPFSSTEKADLEDAVNSIEPGKTHKGFILKLRQRLTFEKLHGNSRALLMLEKLGR